MNVNLSHISIITKPESSVLCSYINHVLFEMTSLYFIFGPKILKDPNANRQTDK